jgi:nicotinamidase-related amidase
MEPHPPALVIERSVAIARSLTKAGGLVVAVHVAFAPDFADSLKQEVDDRMPRPPGGMPPEFSEFAPEIAALNAPVTITKRQWGAFHGTELDLQLRRRGINTIILTGIATNFGVESTAREAWQHGYSVILAEDACSSMSAEMHQFSIEKILPRLARVRQTSEIVAAITGG